MGREGRGEAGPAVGWTMGYGASTADGRARAEAKGDTEYNFTFIMV